MLELKYMFVFYFYKNLNEMYVIIVILKWCKFNKMRVKSLIIIVFLNNVEYK